MITLKSHGFKFSRPEANIIFDVSYFINPWREESIRHEVNSAFRKKKILEFMNAQEGVKEFVESVATLLEQYHKLFPNENIQVAFCCSAGEYRSPAMVIMVSEELNKRHVLTQVAQSDNAKLF